MTDCSSQKVDDSSIKVLVWDAEDAPQVDSGKTILWRSFSDGTSADVISLSQLVEENAEDLRKKYLAWVYEIGETKIHGQRVIDHLELRPGFSYWWMTLLAEKCNFAKSKQIDDAIKLMAFEGWAVNQPISQIRLATSNAPLAECIRAYCIRTGVKFERQRLPAKTDQVSRAKRLYRSLPHGLLALTWLVRYLVQRWPLKGVGLREWQRTDGSVTFISYLFNLVHDAAHDGRFESGYWANLPCELQREGCKTNWLHMYVHDALLPNASKAAATIMQFNDKENGTQVHVTLDTFLHWRVVLKSLRDWLYIRGVGKRLLRTLATDHRVATNHWPLYREDWYRSLIGQASLSNLLNLNLYEAAMNSLPPQRVGIYLQENQGWEFALIHSWKAARHGRLIGAPHSTVRFWDMRYFFDPRNYQRSGKGKLPMPDQVAVNGPVARQAYLEGGYPENQLVGVEALRYLHLTESRDETRKVLSTSGKPLKVLAMGDYLLDNTNAQMHMLERAAHFLPNNTIFVLKPHPACPVKPTEYPGIKITVTSKPLSNLLTACDVAYASSVTSAAVDAYCSGAPVVSILDPLSLNLSPIRRCEGAVFISTPEALADALMSCASILPKSKVPRTFFTLDVKLPCWRRLLLSHSVTSSSADV